MSEQPGTSQPHRLQQQQDAARDFAAEPDAPTTEHAMAEAAERLRKDGGYARARGLTAKAVTRLVRRAYVDDALPVDAIAAALNLSEARAQTEIDRLVKVWHRVDLQHATGEWTVGVFLGTDAVERGDDAQTALDELAREILDRELATARPADATAVRVMLWTNRPERDEEAVSTAERARG
ncbi:hypothetical protein [Kitasatospora sp. NPDC002040]|uniref:hypothetical protein n=1 Tax=Kitasatospora sp. NPDC002040 TaxID=3154661 RepID=UPI00331A0528